MGLASTLVRICKGGAWESQTPLTVLGAFKKIFRKAQQATQVLHDDQKIWFRKLIFFRTLRRGVAEIYFEHGKHEKNENFRLFREFCVLKKRQINVFFFFLSKIIVNLYVISKKISKFVGGKTKMKNEQ